MSKDYLINYYKTAYIDFLTAKNEEAAWNARKVMASTERTAMILYGFEFCDFMKESVING